MIDKFILCDTDEPNEKEITVSYLSHTELMFVVRDPDLFKPIAVFSLDINDFMEGVKTLYRPKPEQE